MFNLLMSYLGSPTSFKDSNGNLINYCDSSSPQIVRSVEYCSGSVFLSLSYTYKTDTYSFDFGIVDTKEFISVEDATERDIVEIALRYRNETKS